MSTALGMLADRMRPGAESLAAMQGYLDREPAWSAAIMERLGVDGEAKWRRTAPRSPWWTPSLALCWGKAEMACGNGLDPQRPIVAQLTRTGPFSAVVSPWPFVMPELVVETEAMLLPGRFPDAAAMRARPGAPPAPLPALPPVGRMKLSAHHPPPACQFPR